MARWCEHSSNRTSNIYLRQYFFSALQNLESIACIEYSAGRNLEICFGRVLFSLDEWILCLDNQNLQSTCPMDKCSEKNVFCPKGGAVLRELAPNQHGLGSHYGVDGICGLSMLLVLSLIVPRGFSSG